MTHLQFIIPRVTNQPVDEKSLAKWCEKWQDTTGQLENIWLTRSSYVAGSTLTIADLLGKTISLISD
jgi:hypothetical protein